MASGKSTREYLTIQRNLSLIVDNLAATTDPARLALKLHEIDLIPSDVVDRASVVGILTPAQRIQPIVMAIKTQIQLDVSKFQSLMRALETCNAQLAERLRKFYSSDLELNVVNAVADVHDWQTLAQQLDYDPIHQQELCTSGRSQEHCRKEMLTTWARKDHRASWKKLAEALERMQEQQVANRIREEFFPAKYNQDQAEMIDEEEIELLTPTPAMNRYKEYLRAVYIRQMRSSESKCSPNSTPQYINLAMISKHKESKAEFDAFTKATIHGDIDDIIETKTEIALEDIGVLEDGSPAQCILVQGAPGVGKTTLAWELCRQWGIGALFRKYAIVLLWKMRDRSLRNAKRISDLFQHQDPELQAAITKDVLQRNGKSVLIILEGYDELSSELQEESIFASLLEGKELPKATVIVTSRTSSSDIVYEKCKTAKFQHIEVVGFTKEQIESYIESYIKNVAVDEVFKTFRQYLEKYPHIHGLMYVPLNCRIVLDVYTSRSSREDPPKTQTELYTALTKTLLCRYLVSHSVHGTQRWRLSSFSDLPSSVYTMFLQLCNVAYEGILCNRLIFSDLPATQETLGLMQAVPELYGSEEASAISHNFLHLTLQEFLSAVHISTFSQPMLVKTLEGMFGKKHLVVVLQFLAGLTKLAIQKVSFISKVSTFFRKSPVQCVRSMQRDAVGFVESLHWLFEAQEKELLSQILGRNIQDRNLSSQTLGPFDCYALGYCIANSQCVWKLNLKNCSITEEGMRMLAGDCDGSLRSVAVLDLGRNCIATKGGAALSSALKGNTVLTELRLGLCGIGTDGTTSLMETLKTIHTLQVLDISGSTVALVAGKSLAQILNSSSLRELNLSYCAVDSDTTRDLARVLHGNSKLQELWLRGNPIGEAGAEALVGMLDHNNNLKSLDLTGCVSIGEGGVEKLVAVLHQNVSLKMLQLPDNLRFTGSATEKVLSRINWTSDISTEEVIKLESYINHSIVSALKCNSVLTKLTLNQVDAGGLAKLAGVLHELSTLKTLELEYCRIGSRGAKHLATVLRGSSALTELRLDWCGIDGVAMSQLYEAISTIPTLSVLDLSYSKLGSEGASYLATALRGSSALTELRLRKCGIDGVAMSQLHEAMSTIPTLSVLDLGYNNLGSEGARHLATALRGCSALTELRLEQCGIDGVEMSQLHEAISTIPTLSVLNLSHNNLGLQGARHLAQLLKSTHSLTELGLHCCDLGGAEDVIRLLEGLEHNITVTKLTLSSLRYRETVTSAAVYSNVKDRVDW